MKNETNEQRVTRLAKANEAKARKMALELLNDTRVADGKKPLKRLERQWWRVYGNEWRERARQSN